MGFDLQPDGLTSGLAGHCQLDKDVCLLQERQFHILSSDVVRIKSARVSHLISVQ